MKVIDITNAIAPMSKYARRATRETVVVTMNGKPIAAVVGLKNSDMETVSLSTNPRFLALIERSRVRQEVEGGVSGKEMRQRLGMKSVSKKSRCRKNK
ncbi:MAG: hypothetical protein AB1546_13495 [bacterium]